MDIGKFKNLPIKEMMEHFGFKNVRTYYMGERGNGTDDDPADGSDVCRNETDTHKSRVAIGYRPIEYHGLTKTIIGVVIRGTAEDDDWDSDFDMGDLDYKNGINLEKYDSSYEEELKHFTDGYTDWTHDQHHAGFDIVSNRIIEIISEYITEINSNIKGKLCFWVTGHSMGAGVANLVAANLIDKGHRDNVYCYTFAAPNTFYRTDNREDNYKEPHGVNYRCIFNIVNEDDFVPKLPMEQCEWTKYGRTATASFNILKGYKTIRVVPDEHLSNNERFKFVKYIGNIDACDEVVTALVEIYKDNKDNMRENTYMLDDNDYKIVQHIADEDLTNAIRNRYVRPYQKNETIGVSGTEFIIKQKQMPAYFMNVLAGALHTSNNTGATIEPFTPLLNNASLLTIPYASRYINAKNKVFDNNKKITFPHYTETYYNLTKMMSTIDFK